MEQMAAPKVLTIDDDEDIARLAKIALSGKGYQVRTATDARHGLVMAMSDPPDLILLDYVMPGWDGMDFLNDLRALPELQQTPVIMITCLGTPDVVSEARQKRVVDFIVKPYDVSLLIERVSKILPITDEEDPEPSETDQKTE
jgi:DNA-binding response OmpR family regulator